MPMNSKEMRVAAAEFLTTYLRRVQAIREGSIRVNEGFVVLYPDLLLMVESPQHFIVELLGAVERFDNLRIKQHRAACIPSH